MTAPLTTQLPPIAMHAPVEIEVRTHVRLPDGRSGTISFLMPSGQIPSRLEVKSAVDALLSPEAMAESSIPAGTRPMTKPEFVAHITKRETGESIPVPGPQDWTPANIEIPHDMLVDAIVGAADPLDEYVERGLAHEIGVDGETEWLIEKLFELPSEMLLAIYKEVA